MRKENWAKELSSTLETWQNMPFIWGETDCFHFAMACINNMTGRTIAAEINCTYSTFRGSLKQLKKEFQVNGLAEFASSLFAHIPLVQARRGDLVLYQGALGICLGRKSAFMTETQGLMFMETLQCQDAWRVE